MKKWIADLESREGVRLDETRSLFNALFAGGKALRDPVVAKARRAMGGDVAISIDRQRPPVIATCNVTKGSNIVRVQTMTSVVAGKKASIQANDHLEGGHWKNAVMVKVQKNKKTGEIQTTQKAVFPQKNPSGNNRKCVVDRDCACKGTNECPHDPPSWVSIPEGNHPFDQGAVVVVDKVDPAGSNGWNVTLSHASETTMKNVQMVFVHREGSLKYEKCTAFLALAPTRRERTKIVKNMRDDEIMNLITQCTGQLEAGKKKMVKKAPKKAAPPETSPSPEIIVISDDETSPEPSTPVLAPTPPPKTPSRAPMPPPPKTPSRAPTPPPQKTPSRAPTPRKTPSPVPSRAPTPQRTPSRVPSRPGLTSPMPSSPVITSGESSSSFANRKTEAAAIFTSPSTENLEALKNMLKEISANLRTRFAMFNKTNSGDALDKWGKREKVRGITDKAAAKLEPCSPPSYDNKHHQACKGKNKRKPYCIPLKSNEKEGRCSDRKIDSYYSHPDVRGKKGERSFESADDVLIYIICGASNGRAKKIPAPPPSSGRSEALVNRVRSVCVEEYGKHLDELQAEADRKERIQAKRDEKKAEKDREERERNERLDNFGKTRWTDEAGRKWHTTKYQIRPGFTLVTA